MAISKMLYNLDTSRLTCLPTLGQLLAKILANMSTDTWLILILSCNVD